MLRIYKIGRLLFVNGTMKKSSSNAFKTNEWGISFGDVNANMLGVTFGNKSRLEAIDSAIELYFNFKHDLHLMAVQLGGRGRKVEVLFCMKELCSVDMAVCEEAESAEHKTS